MISEDKETGYPDVGYPRGAVQDADFIWAKKLRKLLEEELPEIDGRPRKELWDLGRLGISLDFSLELL